LLINDHHGWTLLRCPALAAWTDRQIVSRCHVVSGQWYLLGHGWTDGRPALNSYIWTYPITHRALWELGTNDREMQNWLKIQLLEHTNISMISRIYKIMLS